MNDDNFNHSHQTDDEVEKNKAAPVDTDEEQQTSPETDEQQPTTIEENDQNKMNSTDDKPSQTKPKQTSKKRALGISAIIGGIGGGIIVCLTVLILFSSGIISVGDQTNEADNTTEQGNAEQAISSNVSNDDDVDIEDTTKAIVGVSRLQQTNVWEPSQETGTGSGIIYKKDKDKAYVVTNQHVVNEAEEVEVTLNNDEQIPAQVLGSDELADLAVLEIDADNIDTVADLGESDHIEVGETVIAIGNPLGMEFSNSLTKGIISGLNRSVNVDTTGNGQPDWVTEVIQTDAAINPGNSGGALVNTDGEVIGINSMKIAQNAVEGIGFAIPIDSAKPIIDQLETDGEVSRPFIGITAVSMEEVPMQYRDNIEIPDDFDGGIVVANVEQGSPAAKAGLEQFDVITEIDGEKVESFLDLRKHLYTESEVGDTLTIEFYHNGDKQTEDLKLIEREGQS